MAILHKGKVALLGKVKDLTSGKGYRMTASQVPEALATEFHGLPSPEPDGLTHFAFAARDELNRAIDATRAAGCEIESVAPSTSTLEEVFLRTVARVKTWAIVVDTFREAFARKVFWGLFALSTLIVLFMLFLIRIDIVEGANADPQHFRQAAARCAR